MKLTLATLVTLATITSAIADLPLAFHAGKIEAVQVTTETQRFTNLAKCAAQNKKSPTSEVPEDLCEDKEPAEGKQFVILKITPTPARTISPFDYKLVSDGNDFPCLSLALVSNNVYDFRRTVHESSEPIYLIFETPSNLENVMFTCVYAGIPYLPVGPIQLIEKPAATEEAEKPVAAEEEKPAAAEEEEKPAAAEEEKPAANDEEEE